MATPEHTAVRSKKHKTHKRAHIQSHTHTHTQRVVRRVAEECSVTLVCVNDSPRRTGEYVKNSGCDLLWSEAGWDMTQRFTQACAHTHIHGAQQGII